MLIRKHSSHLLLLKVPLPSGQEQPRCLVEEHIVLGFLGLQLTQWVPVGPGGVYREGDHGVDGCCELP